MAYAERERIAQLERELVALTARAEAAEAELDKHKQERQEWAITSARENFLLRANFVAKLVAAEATIARLQAELASK